MRLKWKLVSVRLEILLIFKQDKCMFCAEPSKAQKSFWTHPMKLVGDVGLMESRFGPFGDNVSVGAR